MNVKIRNKFIEIKYSVSNEVYIIYISYCFIPNSIKFDKLVV